MYLKVLFTHNPNLKDIATYYRLVESYRNESDRVCHKTLLNIGFWPDATSEQKYKVVVHINKRYKNELALFEETDEFYATLKPNSVRLRVIGHSMQSP